MKINPLDWVQYSFFIYIRLPGLWSWQTNIIHNRDGQSVGHSTDKRTDVGSRDFKIWKINSGLWAVVWAGKKMVWADYEQLLRPVFSIFRVNIFFENNLASALKSCIKPFFLISKFFLSPDKVKKTSFLRAKNLSVNTWRLGPDICSLIWCVVLYAIYSTTHQRSVEVQLGRYVSKKYFAGVIYGQKALMC